jgi:hypothetical protein
MHPSETALGRLRENRQDNLRFEFHRALRKYRHANSHNLFTSLSIWHRILEQYAAAGVTKAEDTLPALSGVAAVFYRIGTGLYLAGLWTADLRSELCWFFGECAREYSVYVAPSFSWASCETHGRWPDYSYDWKAEKLVDVLCYHTILVHPSNPFGRVREASFHFDVICSKWSLGLSCHLYQFSLISEHRKESSSVLQTASPPASTTWKISMWILKKICGKYRT